MAHFRITQHFVRRLLNPSADRITNSFFFTAQGLRYRKLEVILTTTIDKLGKAGDTVKVVPGYFRNHLMPKLLAVPNIDKFAYLIREQRKLYQREEEEPVIDVSKAKVEIQDTSLIEDGLPKEDKIKEYQTAAIRLHKGRLSLKRMIKVENELRSPVTKEDIVAEVARQLCICIHPENLHLPSPITTVGRYEVPLRLPREIPRPEGTLQWTLKVNVRRKRSGNESPRQMSKAWKLSLASVDSHRADFSTKPLKNEVEIFHLLREHFIFFHETIYKDFVKPIIFSRYCAGFLRGERIFA